MWCFSSLYREDQHASVTGLVEGWHQINPSFLPKALLGQLDYGEEGDKSCKDCNLEISEINELRLCCVIFESLYVNA